MGHDIFACLERRHTSSRQWEFLCEDVRISRHYTLFTIFAGVYDVHGHALTPIAAPRGIPNDLSFDAELAFKRWGKGDDEAEDSEARGTWADDAYYSYLMYDELLRAQQLFRETEDDMYDSSESASGQRSPPKRLAVTDNARETQEEYHTEKKSRGKNGLHIDLEAILAYLKIYEDRGYNTRMIFGFD